MKVIFSYLNKVFNKNMPPKTRSKKSSDSLNESSDNTTLTPSRKRGGANFSTILTPFTPQRTQSQTEVFARQAKVFSKKYKGEASGSSSKDAESESKVKELIAKFEQIPPARKSTTKVKVQSATSQNHIISDKYLGEILEKSITKIRQYIISGNEKKVELAVRQEQAVKDFFTQIFHHTENTDLQHSLSELQKYLHPESATSSSKELLQKLCSYVAARGSNNAVEGDASANSGIGESMDAPVDLQGRLLLPFETMRNNFLELCKIVSLVVKDDDAKGRDEELQELAFKAISPDVIGGKIRFSSKAYKGNAGDGAHYEAPSFLESSEKNFRVGDIINKPVITAAQKSKKKSLTEAQEKHFGQGLFGHRSSTPNLPRKVNYSSANFSKIQDANSSATSTVPSSPSVSPIPFLNDDYTDDKLNQLFNSCFAPNIHYVTPAIALVNTELNNAIDNFTSSNATKLVIAVHKDDHYMGIFIEKKGAEFSIIYFDPTVSYENRGPLHDIPDNIQQSLLQKFPNTEIVSISSAIQSYKLEGEDVIVIDNNHCGPFVCYFMSSLANGNAQLNPDGSNTIQVKLANDQWQNIDILSSEQSDKMGNEIRDLHDDIIAAPDVAMNHAITFDFAEEQPSSAVNVKGLVDKFERLVAEDKEKAL